jgi:bacteriorhodopsin
MAVLAVAVEVYKWTYLHFGMQGYLVLTAVCMLVFIVLARRTIAHGLTLREPAA